MIGPPNPSDKNGEISKCNVCGAIYHSTKKCPDSYKNRMRSKDEPKITLTGENMDTLIGETLKMAVTDSGCTKTVCGDTWLNCFLQTISQTDFEEVSEERSKMAFKLGNGKVLK